MPDDSADLERVIRIAARPETIFALFTDPSKMIRWKGLKATLNARPGGDYRIELNGRDVARGEYVEITPYTRIVFTWGWEGDDSPLPPGRSTVEITLTADGDTTILRLRHYGLPDEPSRQLHAAGWDHYLPRLTIVAEGRDAGPDPRSTAEHHHL